MMRLNLTDNNRVKLTATVFDFLAAFCFFQFVYPYHLIRREQMSLFVYDWNYIIQTYNGTGWLVRFVSDFLEQFFHIPSVGPLVVSLLLTSISVVAFRICDKFTGKWTSLIVAAILFLWSFMRETGNLYVTRYTIAVLGYLSILLVVLNFRKRRAAVAAVLLSLFGVWALGAPFQSNYGKLWGIPNIEYDRMIGLDDELSREHWDKVLKLSEKDLYMVEASYCYNLAQAMKGRLGDKLFDHSQRQAYDLLLHVSGNHSTFTNCLAGEAWFQLGAMTIAEQSAITALQASPNHTGARYLVRLARVNLISGQNAAAEKYLNMLSKTLFYGKWARSMMPDTQSDAVRAEIMNARSKMAVSDFVHLSDVPRSVLLGLLEANPDNLPARNFLLCYDLMRYDLEQFIEDYTPCMIKAHIYQEAVLIWLSQQGVLSEETAAEYGVEASMMNTMNRFFRMPDKYRNTYWYYYLNALEEN